MKGLGQGPVSNSQEAETIRQAQQGDADAFEQLYRLHSSHVYAVCLRMLKHTGEAEDLTQQTFLTVFRSIRTFRGQSAFSSWLHRVTTNCVLMHLRKKPAHQVSLEEIMQTGEESGTTRKELSHYDLRLKGLIDRLSIEKAIAQLSACLKRTFVLYDLWGCEHGEVAKILACSAGTSKSRLHKARRRLRELLPEIPAGYCSTRSPVHLPASPLG